MAAVQLVGAETAGRYCLCNTTLILVFLQELS